jgi:ribonuclease-3
MRKELSTIFAGLLGGSRQNVNESLSVDLDFKYHGLLSDEGISFLNQVLGLKIQRPGIYERALMHRSFLQVRQDLALESNERLEFLGDAVLDMIVSDYLFQNHESLPEGTLSQLRANIVNKDTLVDCAEQLKLGDIIIMSYGAQAAIAKGSKSILADAVEALIAAVYIENGYRVVQRFVLEKILPLASGYIQKLDNNYKSRLQEILQADSKPQPNYSVLTKEGPDHKKIFKVQAFAGDIPLSIGKGENKQKAEQDAARNSLKLLQKGK